MAKLVGKKYAEALFDVAIELDKLEQFKDEILFISQVFQKEPKLNIIIQHPKISKAEKKDIINSIFKGRVSQEILNLMYIVIDKERERDIQDISDEYINLFNEKYGIVDAQAITAIPMTEDEKLALSQKLSKKFNKKVNLTNIVDKDIIGGILVKVQDKVIDESIRKQLDMLQEDLQGVKVSKE